MKFLETVNRFIWGVPALLMILGVGLYLSFRTKFVQFSLFPEALKAFLRQFKRPIGGSDTSPYRALCTALAATVGTGNLVGVAGAIAIGGPGSIFWMWICALLGMVIKFAEATLAVRYRVRNIAGEYVGGPMYMIRRGLSRRWSWLASSYCFLGIITAFGVGNATQVNAVICGGNSIISALGGQESVLTNITIGIILALLVAGVLLGGAKRIGQTAELLVPFASVGYLLLGVVVLTMRATAVPGAFIAIVEGAFSPRAVTGGMLGSAFQALRIGASRGTFTNEAGMGTASIAHASATVAHPVEQGLMGIIEVFLDTIVICTMTALVILCSGIRIPYGTDAGATLTSDAFSTILGDWVSIPIAVALCCFAVATIFGWSLYGVRCAQYLLGERAWRAFVLLQTVAVVVGAVLNTGTVWLISETLNGLMAIPNLIALVCLSPELVKLIKTYKAGA